MQLTADLSLYPLQSDYIPIINGFIHDLNQEPGLVVITNAMSTQLKGESERVFDAVHAVLERSVEAFGKQVLVCKFMPGDLPIEGD